MTKYAVLFSCWAVGAIAAPVVEIPAIKFNSNSQHTRYRVECQIKSEAVQEKKGPGSRERSTSSQSFSSISFDPIATLLNELCRECLERAKGNCRLDHDRYGADTCAVDEISRWNKTTKQWEENAGEWLVKFRDIDLSCPAKDDKRLGEDATVLVMAPENPPEDLPENPVKPKSPPRFIGPELPPGYRPPYYEWNWMQPRGEQRSYESKSSGSYHRIERGAR